MRQVILITGHTLNGKSTLAKNLENRFDFKVFKTSTHIQQIANERSLHTDKQSLKNLGDTIDIETEFQWLLDKTREFASTLDKSTPIVIDSIRKAEQLKTFREQLEFEVTHVHLYTSDKSIKERFDRKKNNKSPTSAPNSLIENDLINSKNDINFFAKDADVRIFTDRTDSEDTFTRVAAYLGLYPSPDRKCVDVLIGGQYGSEGKGQVSAFLSKEYDVLMRVGGPNAGHNAIGTTGKYTYHSLPSGCRESDSDVLIGPGATIYIKEFLKEISECNLTPERIFLDPQVMVITNEDRKAEGVLKDAIGSTGRGGGAAAARRINERLKETDRAKLAKDYPELNAYIKSTHTRLQKAYASGEKVLLEGTQGSLLSLFHGPYPHVTSRDTNVSGCLAEAGIPPRRVNRVLMVIRYTPIRVQSPKNGSSGKLKHETDFMTIAKEANLPEDIIQNEKTSTTKLNRRVGWFEWDKFRYACELNAPTDIILTFADYQNVKNRKARRFEQLDIDLIKFVEEIARVAQAPVSLINTRYPHDEDIPLDLRTLIDRRRWRTKVKSSVQNYDADN